MRRIRLVFLVLAVALAVPLLLLLERALDSVAAERVLRHRTVADRVIDEMERELNELVRREEERPYGHYRFFFVPEDGSELRRSPLAELPKEPFILGYFQIDPDGTVSSPMWPEDPVAAAADGWAPDDEVSETAELLATTVRTAWRTPSSSRGEVRASEEEEQQVAGDDGNDDRALDVIQKLNRAAIEREKRGSKVAETQAESLYRFSRPADDTRQAALPPTADSGRTNLPTQRGGTEAPATYDILVEPLTGRPASNEGILIYRTVVIGRQIYRQGFLISRPELVEWLSGRVLESTGLGGAITIRADVVGEPGEAAPENGGRFTYHHRFADPFKSLVTTLVIDPLPELRGTRYVVSLAVLLVVAATLGLFALYRMTAVVVSFAERRSDFVSAVTHELKTPLTAVRMYGEMLRDGVVLEEKKARYYATITAESERLSRLVDNVLELSRLERRNRHLRLEDADVEPVLREVATVLGPHVEKAGLVLRLDVAPDTGPARFDRDALLQVLFNLVDNAVKYASSTEEPEVDLVCRPHSRGGVSILVQDRGPGVAPRQLKKIFEPFYRGQRELTRTTQGSGIGLALVRGLVEEMGGSVVGRNRDGGGFEVEIVLPPAPSSKP